MTPQPPEQPRTAAGRALLARANEWDMPLVDPRDVADTILAIEAEASATELTGDGTGTALPAAPDPVASPPEALRLLHDTEALLNQPLGKSRRELAERIRRYLVATEEGTP